MNVYMSHILYIDTQGHARALEDDFGSCDIYALWIKGSDSFKTKTTDQLKKYIKGLLGNLQSFDDGIQLVRSPFNDITSQWK
mmetsp:Transcript_25364/g.24309  ORF Transcript_25364/g.24309 Transcript_25364/m.24309 type:complete len:82 (-) Transcript_25364:1111-1356(-)